jgi:hypothetical protein
LLNQIVANQLRWLVVCAFIGLVPIVVVIASVVVPDVMRGDLNPLIQVTLVGLVVAGVIFWVFIRRLIDEAVHGRAIAFTSSPKGVQVRFSSFAVSAVLSMILGLISIVVFILGIMGVGRH